MNWAVMPASSANGNQPGRPTAQKKMPWNSADSAASTIFEATYPPVFCSAMSQISPSIGCRSGGSHTATCWMSRGPAAAM